MLDTHCEKELVINNRELSYRGIFRAGELFSALNRALEERGYQKREKKTEEFVSEEGRKVLIELRPYKEKTSYAFLMIKIKVLLDKVTEKVEERDGHKKKFEHGNVSIIFDAWLMTDYEERWGMKPWVYFFKGAINKFLYKFPLEGSFKGELEADTGHIYGKVKGLLDSYGPQKEGVADEEEVRREVAREIGGEEVKKPVGG